MLQALVLMYITYLSGSLIGYNTGYYSTNTSMPKGLFMCVLLVLPQILYSLLLRHEIRTLLYDLYLLVDTQVRLHLHF